MRLISTMSTDVVWFDDIPRFVVGDPTGRERVRWEGARRAAIVPAHEAYLIDLQNGAEPPEAECEQLFPLR
jgi:hypothetical protein